MNDDKTFYHDYIIFFNFFPFFAWSVFSLSFFSSFVLFFTYVLDVNFFFISHEAFGFNQVENLRNLMCLR